MNRKSILNNGAKVVYTFPGTIVFGAELFEKRLYKINKERGIVLKHGYDLSKIDGPNKKAYYKRKVEINVDGGPITMNDDNHEIKEKNQDGLYIIDSEVCHLAPPQRAFKRVSESKLAYQDDKMVLLKVESVDTGKERWSMCILKKMVFLGSSSIKCNREK